MQVRKCYIFLGPIASGKTYQAKVAAMNYVNAKYIDLDQLIHNKKSALFLEQLAEQKRPEAANLRTYLFEEFLNKFVAYMKDILSESDVVIDGWFSFEQYWWLTQRKEIINSLQFLRANLPEVKFICEILREDKAVILKRISEDKNKFKYNNYDEHIDLVYNFLEERLKEFNDIDERKGDG